MVINISKLVNGKSVFGLSEKKNYSIGSIVIDDMHACIGSIQEQFSISIPRDDELYQNITDSFFTTMNEQAEGRFSDIIEGRNTFDNMLVPFWKWQEKSQKIYNILSKNQHKRFLLFKWNLIKDSLKFCHCYISSSEINIIPIVHQYIK